MNEAYEEWLESEDSYDDAIYSKQGRYKLIENDELNAFEEAFMDGYEEAEI